VTLKNVTQKIKLHFSHASLLRKCGCLEVGESLYSVFEIADINLLGAWNIHCRRILLSKVKTKALVQIISSLFWYFIAIITELKLEPSAVYICNWLTC
jgi:hypothetical protein